MKVRKRDFYDTVEAALLKVPGASKEIGQLSHRFTDGVYMRHLHLSPGDLCIGHRHKTKHFNILLSGTVTITASDGMAATLTAPHVFESGPGVRKIALAHTAVEMCSVHPNPDNCKNVTALEDRFVTKSKAFLEWEKRKALSDSAK